MLRNRPAADELADIRAEIKALKAREQILRDLVLRDPDSRTGTSHEVVIRRQKQRVFCRERLPGYVARDPAFWDSKVTQQVTVRERQSTPTETGSAPERAIRPGDPADTRNAVDGYQLMPRDGDSYDVLESFRQ